MLNSLDLRCNIGELTRVSDQPSGRPRGLVSAERYKGAARKCAERRAGRVACRAPAGGFKGAARKCAERRGAVRARPRRHQASKGPRVSAGKDA